MLTLSDLMEPRTATQYRALLLAALQGIGYVSKAGTGSGSATASGLAQNAYSVRLKFSTAGGLGTAAFQVSTNGGSSYGAPVALSSSGTYAVGSTGLTMQFADGPTGTGNSFEVGDTYAVELTVPVFPATSWQPGSAALTLIEKDAELLEERDKVLAAVAAGGLLYTATGEWLTLLAKQVYDTDRQLAVTTVGTFSLYNHSASAIVVSPGGVWAGTIDGRRFVNRTGGTIPAKVGSTPGELVLTWQAEEAGGGWNIAANGITTLYTSLPGVSVNNPNSSWYTTAGRDVETDEALRQRCIARWPSLSEGSGNEDVYVRWALDASPAVTRVKVQPSATVPGQAELYLADPDGTVAAGAVTAVQSALSAKVAYPSTVLAIAAVEHPYTVTATLYCYAGHGAAAKAEAEKLLEAQAAATPIGGTVFESNIIEELSRPTGVRNVTPSSPAGGNVVPGPTEVVKLSHAITYTEV